MRPLARVPRRLLDWWRLRHGRPISPPTTTFDAARIRRDLAEIAAAAGLTLDTGRAPDDDGLVYCCVTLGRVPPAVARDHAYDYPPDRWDQRSGPRSPGEAGRPEPGSRRRDRSGGLLSLTRDVAAYEAAFSGLDRSERPCCGLRP